MLDIVTPSVNPLKNIINITTNIPIIEIPNIKIINNCNILFIIELENTFIPKTSADNFLILKKKFTTWLVSVVLSLSPIKFMNSDPITSPIKKTKIINITRVFCFFNAVFK